MPCRFSTPGREFCRPASFANGASSPLPVLLQRSASRFPARESSAFPAALGPNLRSYLEAVAVDAVGLDWTVELGFARDQVQARRPVQGNLDPLALLTGGAPLDRSIDAILEALAGGPFIFNLGHGILPETPIAHVERLIERVRKGAA